MLKHKISLFFLLVLFLMQGVAASCTRINDLRFFADDAKVRLVFDASGPINYTTQESSDNIIINIKNAKLVGLLNKTWLHKTPVKAVQSRQIGKDLRLILDLKNPIKLKAFALQKPHRLALDLIEIKATPEKITEKITNDDKIAITEERIMKQINTPETIETEEVINKNEVIGKEQTNASDSRDAIIVIDPGHGGKDPGAVGFGGTREKDIALMVAKNLQNIISKTKGFRAVLTRDSDYFITLRERLGIAHKHKADMFIAIHADAYKYREAHGASVFALSQRGATSEAARWLAEKENESELSQTISDKNELLKSVLIDLAQAATIKASLEIGESMLKKINRIASLHSSRVEQAAFVVLKSPDIPSILVETGFISDPYEEGQLRNPEYQRKIATCLATGITEYFTRRPPR